MQELWAGPVCDARAFAEIRRRALLDACKWDPQVGDISTLAPFPLVMTQKTWAKLSSWAEQLTAEALAAEIEILSRPKLMEALGLPRRVLAVLQGSEPPTPAALRVIRYDFHPTSAGWRISEANADVPGGYTESSCFTKIFAEQFPTLRVAGNPGASWASALIEQIGSRATVALLAAPGYIEDQQVIAYLAKLLRERGIRAIHCNPRQLAWHDGRAFVRSSKTPAEANAIVRFYQADWLAALPASANWSRLFRGGQTPVVNPGTAALIESKRFPLLWDQLSINLPTWRRLLPETRDPRETRWSNDDSWLLKTAFCDTGDTVSIRALMNRREWARTQFSARLFPNRWVAQRRFEAITINTPHGPGYPCVGVYTIDARAAGAYARIAASPVINFEAVDTPLLIQPND